MTDGERGEKLKGAKVFDADRRLGTASNDYGFFSVTLPANSVTLVVLFLGNAPSVCEVFLADCLRLDV